MKLNRKLNRRNLGINKTCFSNHERLGKITMQSSLTVAAQLAKSPHKATCINRPFNRDLLVYSSYLFSMDITTSL